MPIDHVGGAQQRADTAGTAVTTESWIFLMRMSLCLGTQLWRPHSAWIDLGGARSPDQVQNPKSKAGTTSKMQNYIQNAKTTCITTCRMPKTDAKWKIYI
ncbi:hypothetical protein CLAIMM_14218 [Cladophialophora immunda]|nr:hypothetical protein CLAIMM_14218 [Cladophialophora immunda]